MDAGTAPTTTSDVFRFIVYLDKQCNGAAATQAQILKDAGDYLSYNNLANVRRFQILYDKKVALNSKSGAYDGTTLRYGEELRFEEWYKKCNIDIHYDSTLSTGVIATMKSNNLGVLLITSQGTISVAAKIRIRFIDK